MNQKKLIASIILISLIINLILFWAYYYINRNFELKIQKQDNGIAKIIDKKYIEEKEEVFTKITELQNDIIKVIKKSWASVVSIIVSKDLQVYYEDPTNFFGGYITEEKQKIWWWSWIIISSDGYVITNKHVVQDSNSEYTVVSKDWDVYKVDKIWFDPILDIAIVKILDENWNIPSNLQPAELNSYKTIVKIWQFVVAIWNALAEYENSVSFGIISGKDRQLESWIQESLYLWLYQTDAPINQWNSGWPLLDIEWNVIWINTAISAIWQWIWFAIPINKEFVNSTLQIIKEKQKIVRPFIWVEYKTLNKTIAKNLNLDKFEWIYISGVVQWSNAEKAWLKIWDIITEIDWNKINIDNNFLYLLYTFKPWDKVVFTIYSNKQYKKISMILGER